MSDDARDACPDGGTCGHSCPLTNGKGLPCFRVMAAGPLSGTYPGNRWPAEMEHAHYLAYDAQQHRERDGGEFWSTEPGVLPVHPTYWKAGAVDAAVAEGVVEDGDLSAALPLQGVVRVWRHGAWRPLVLQENLIDLRDRMNRAASTLDAMSEAEGPLVPEGRDARVHGKAEGVRLAMSYLDEVLRG